MAGDFFGTVENVVEVLGAILVAADFGFVPNAKILTSLGGPILISEEDHLHVGMEQCPTLDCVPLNDAAKAMKWLWGRENG